MSETGELLDGYLSKAEVARQLGMSPRTLDRWAATRIGPPRVHVGHKIFYREAAVRRWLGEREERRRRRRALS